MSSIEERAVDLAQNPAGIWCASNVPMMYRGIVQDSGISGETLSEMISNYGESVEPLKDHCGQYGVKMALVLRLADQYPAVAEELNAAERVRARMLEAKALEPYTGTIQESLALIEETKIGKDGCEYTGYSSAASGHIKNQSAILYKAAAIADRKRYGEKDNEGTTVNVAIQNNNNNGPTSLEDLQNMSVAEVIDLQPPGEL